MNTCRLGRRFRADRRRYLRHFSSPAADATSSFRARNAAASGIVFSASTSFPPVTKWKVA